MTTHWLLWDDHGLVPTPTIIWDPDLADRARELGRRVDGPYVLEAELAKLRESRDAWRLQAMREHDERIPDGTYGDAR